MELAGRPAGRPGTGELVLIWLSVGLGCSARPKGLVDDGVLRPSKEKMGHIRAAMPAPALLFLPQTPFCPGNPQPVAQAPAPTREKGVASLGGRCRRDQGVQIDQGGGGGAEESFGGFTVLALLARFRQGVSQVGEVKALCPILPGAGEEVTEGVQLWGRGDMSHVSQLGDTEGDSIPLSPLMAHFTPDHSIGGSEAVAWCAQAPLEPLQVWGHVCMQGPELPPWLQVSSSPRQVQLQAGASLWPHQ